MNDNGGERTLKCLGAGRTSRDNVLALYFSREPSSAEIEFLVGMLMMICNKVYSRNEPS